MWQPDGGQPKQAAIDGYFDTDFADRIARLESYNKHLYRPNSYLHKWWARRCGSTFRAILKQLVEDPSRRDYYSPGGLEDKIILDPMMGGGTTLHEAIRLGASVIGADIDAIPLLQARASLSRSNLAALEEQFEQFFDRLRQDLAPRYRTYCPQCDSASEIRFLLYGQRRYCGCGDEVVFVDSYILRHNSDGTTVRLSTETSAIYSDDVLVGGASGAISQRILEKSSKACSQCGEKHRERLAVPFYRRYVPVMVAASCPLHGLVFGPPRSYDLKLLRDADENRPNLGFNPAEFSIAAGPKSRALLQRGIKSYLELFSSRQLHYMRSAMEALATLEPLTRLNLALLVSTSLEFNSMLCGYKGVKTRRAGAIRHAFSRHAYAFPYTALENNPVHQSRSSGTLNNLFQSRIVRGRSWALNPIERRIEKNGIKKVVIKGEIDAGAEVTCFSDLQSGEQRFLLLQGSSTTLELPEHSIDYVVTDPPYFDSVQYGDLAAFFRVWLEQLLPDAAQWAYELADSAVDQRQGSRDGQYATVLGEIFTECRRVLKKKGRLIFTFHHWNPKGWSSLTVALKRAGFVLVNRFVVHAENRASVHIVNQNALVHDVILVLAPVDSAASQAWDEVTTVNKRDSRSFCEQCGTIVGWLLNSALTELEIEAMWRSLLA